MSPSGRPRVANRRLIKPREPHRLADLVRIVVGITLLAIPAFLYAAQQAQLQEYKRSITRLDERLDELAEVQRRLDLELATLQDPQRIERLANGLLGLVPVQQEQVVFLDRPRAPLTRHQLLLAQVMGDVHGSPRP